MTGLSSEIDIQAIIGKTAQLLGQHYVFPEIAETMGQRLHEKLTQGAYDHVGDVHELGRLITQDIQAVSKDKHLNLRWDPPVSDWIKNPQQSDDSWLRLAESRHFGFHRLECLKGNIGYLQLRMFAPAEVAGELAVASMGFMAHMNAMIIDLRDNTGGFPSMIQLLTSYLFNDRQHLNSFYHRSTESTEQFWTLPYVPGKRLPDLDVFVLTSHMTFSAAEEFAYNLQILKRATIVGETTGGGAHPGGTFLVDDNFVMFIPNGRAINPVSGTNWQEIGVQPDIAVPADEALYTAHREALSRIVAKTDAPLKKQFLTWNLESVEAERHPTAVDSGLLERCAGTYGNEVFEYHDGKLYHYHKVLVRRTALTPMAANKFILDDEVRVQFELPEMGSATGVHINRQNSASIRIGRGE